MGFYPIKYHVTLRETAGMENLLGAKNDKVSANVTKVNTEFGPKHNSTSP